MNLSQRVSRRGLKGSLVTWLAFSLALATTVSAMPAQGHVCNGCHAVSRAMLEASVAVQQPEPEAFAAPSDPLLGGTQAYDSASFTLSDTVVRLKAGTYKLFRINADTGQITKQRNVSFATRKNFQTHHNLVKFGSYHYTQLLSGKWSGWYVRANNNAPGASLTSFSDVRQVRMAKGTHVGVRFYNKTRVMVRRSATLDGADTFDVSQRAVFNNKVWFFVTSGPLAQRWVKRSSAVQLVSTTSDDSTPPSSSLGPPATWKGLLMIYRDTDVTFTRSDGSTYRLRARMSDSMLKLTKDVAAKFVKATANWSDNYTAMDFKIVEVPRTIDKLNTLSNGKYWVGPNVVKSDIDKYAPTGTYDSIFVVWEAKDSKGVTVPVGGWGLALAPGSWANGAGYASIHAPFHDWWWTDIKYPHEVFVHEWMHQVLFFHEAAKRIKLDLHAEAQYGYKADNGSFKTWLADVMRGRIKDGSKYIGVNYEMWRAGTPTRPNGWN